MFQRTLNGADMINATSLNLPPNENAVRINGDFGTAGQVLAKDSNNKLNWSRVDEVEIPDNSIGGAKLKNDITIQQKAFDHKEQLLRQAIYDLQTKSDTIIVPHDPANRD